MNPKSNIFWKQSFFMINSPLLDKKSKYKFPFTTKNYKFSID